MPHCRPVALRIELVHKLTIIFIHESLVDGILANRHLFIPL